MIIAMPKPPAALLLDFGGVLAEADPAADWRSGLGPYLADLLGGSVPLERIRADLAAASQAYRSWRAAMARPYNPPELTHEQFWGDLVAADWPQQARATVLAHASELAYRWSDRGAAWRLRPGVRELLAEATAAGIPMAVVSNMLCGAAGRDYLAREGVGVLFGAQIYSDELGTRKPGPAMVYAATDALGVAPAECWFVGDMPLRDVLAGRRAGVGHVILVGTDRGIAHDPGMLPDATAYSMVDVHRLLRDELARAR